VSNAPTQFLPLRCINVRFWILVGCNCFHPPASIAEPLEHKDEN